MKGGKMFREYPDNLTETWPLNLGRGRFIPISWDEIYNGVAIWAGLQRRMIWKVFCQIGTIPIFSTQMIFSNRSILLHSLWNALIEAEISSKIWVLFFTVPSVSLSWSNNWVLWCNMLQEAEQNLYSNKTIYFI